MGNGGNRELGTGGEERKKKREKKRSDGLVCEMEEEMQKDGSAERKNSENEGCVFNWWGRGSGPRITDRERVSGSGAGIIGSR